MSWMSRHQDAALLFSVAKMKAFLYPADELEGAHRNCCCIDHIHSPQCPGRFLQDWEMLTKDLKVVVF